MCFAKSKIYNIEFKNDSLSIYQIFMKSVFNQNDVNDIIARINALSINTQPQWGKMNVAQMLAHCNVAYEMAFENNHPKAGFFKRLLLNLFVKPTVVGDKPYKKNSPTAPAFLITSEKDFETEKGRMIDYLHKTKSLGEKYFEGKESVSFGKLTAQEWNTMFYKHLNHHLTQFGV